MPVFSMDLALAMFIDKVAQAANQGRKEAEFLAEAVPGDGEKVRLVLAFIGEDALNFSLVSGDNQLVFVEMFGDEAFGFGPIAGHDPDIVDFIFEGVNDDSGNLFAFTCC